MYQNLDTDTRDSIDVDNCIIEREEAEKSNGEHGESTHGERESEARKARRRASIRPAGRRTREEAATERRYWQAAACRR